MPATPIAARSPGVVGMAIQADVGKSSQTGGNSCVPIQQIPLKEGFHARLTPPLDKVASSPRVGHFPAAMLSTWMVFVALSSVPVTVAFCAANGSTLARLSSL